MKCLITILTYLFFITQTTSAQEVVPVHQEPRHHLVYENDILQVLDVQIPVGDTTLYHTHDAPIFYVFISASSTDDQELGNKWRGVTASDSPLFETGEVACNLDYADKPVTHRVRNVGNSLFRLIGVINRRNQPVDDVIQNGLPGNVETDNRWFHQSRADVAPDESLEFPVSNSPIVIVQVDEGKLKVSIGEDSLKLLSSPGDFAATNPSQHFEVMNEGSNPVEIVIIRVN